MADHRPASPRRPCFFGERWRRVAGYCLVIVGGLAGCVYTDTSLDFAESESFHPLPPGYWRMCLKAPKQREDCHVLRHDVPAGNGGVFVGTAGAVSTYAARQLNERTFVYQTHMQVGFNQAYFYALARILENGDVVLTSPDCHFSEALMQKFRAAGIRFPFFSRSCAVANATAESLVAEMRILAEDKSWGFDQQQILTALPATQGLAEFDGEKRAALPEPLTTTPARSDAELDNIESLVDQRLIRWSSSWRVDKYVPGSARVLTKDSAGETVSFSGKFTFIRQGIFHRITFTGTAGAAERRRSGLRRLCYDDHTTGMTDCVY